MFDAAPEAFHKDMVQCPASPVHADCDAVSLENISKHRAGELTALVRVEYLRHTVDLYRLFQAVHAESLTAYSTTAMPAPCASTSRSLQPDTQSLATASHIESSP